MARNRIKVHPFGYKKLPACIKKYGYQEDNIQPVTITVEYKAPVTRKGKPVYGFEFDKNGKKHKVLKTTTHYNTIVKYVRHTMSNKPRKGRTLGDMVYESYKAKTEN